MRIARASQQLNLLSVAPIFRATNNASARNAYGSAAQEIVCATLNIKPIPINGNCEVCFDAEGVDGEFYEIKSVRRGHKVVLYNWRMRKEARSKEKLFYAILIHRISRQREDILSKMLDAGPCIIVIPAKKVHRIARNYPTHRLKSNTQSGYNRKGYKKGYRNVPITALQALTKHSQWEFAQIYDRTLPITVSR